jgi:hypothetical protein
MGEVVVVYLTITIWEMGYYISFYYGALQPHFNPFSIGL